MTVESQTFDNGVIVSGFVVHGHQSYRYANTTRYRDLDKAHFTAYCPNCTWTSQARSLPALRRKARTHVCD